MYGSTRFNRPKVALVICHEHHPAPVQVWHDCTRKAVHKMQYSKRYRSATQYTSGMPRSSLSGVNVHFEMASTIHDCSGSSDLQQQMGPLEVPSRCRTLPPLRLCCCCCCCQDATGSSSTTMYAWQFLFDLALALVGSTVRWTAKVAAAAAAT